MKVSIITVCYNSEKTIFETLSSVKNQSYKNIEYIVVDGESNDRTKHIIKNFSGIIDKFISEKDEGLYDAMNKGISISTGDIVGILNSDDIFFNDKVIEDVVNFHTNNNVDASIGSIVQTNITGNIVREYSSNAWKPWKLKHGFMPPHPSIFFDRKLFKKFGDYRLDFVSGADYELIVRFFLKNSIKWKSSNITTTKMLVGGISSSGFSSYNLISKEIVRALSINNVSHSSVLVYLRGLIKILNITRFEYLLSFFIKPSR